MLQDRSQTWLKAAAALVGGFGLLVALAAHPATAPPTNLLADVLIWPLDGKEAIETPIARLLAAVGGGVMAGWGALLWLVASEVMPKDPALGRRLVLFSVGTWFAVDSLASMIAGVPLNVIGNVAFLGLFLFAVRS